MFGKPNIVVNPQKLYHAKFINMALSTFSPDDIVQLAENYSGQDNDRKSEAFDKILKQIEDMEENEYNVTEIKTRGEKNKEQDIKYNLNTSFAIRLLEKTDSSVKKNSYIHQLAKNNHEQLKRVLHNNGDILNNTSVNNNLIYLQVKGQNKLIKEIEETKDIEDKQIDHEAIYRHDPVDSEDEKLCSKTLSSKSISNMGKKSQSIVLKSKSRNAVGHNTMKLQHNLSPKASSISFAR